MKKILYLLLVIIMNIDCGAIFNTSQQLIRIYPNSESSTIFINDRKYEHKGEKFEIKLNRDNYYRIKVVDSNKNEETFVLDKKISKWVWGSIFLAGIYGLVLDYGSGGLYKLIPYDNYMNNILYKSKNQSNVIVNNDNTYAIYELLNSSEKKKILRINVIYKNKKLEAGTVQKGESI